jgi:hypothetical protein
VLVHHGLGNDTAEACHRRAADYFRGLLREPPLPTALVH